MIKNIAKIKLRMLDLEGGGKHLAVNCRINGKKSVLLIDTGASSSIFDKDNKAFADTSYTDVQGSGSGSGFNSEIQELHLGIIPIINISRFKIENENVVFTSMKHINELYKSLGLPRIAGILGGDILFRHNAVIDFGNQLLLLEKK